jgi:hypothetical protein
MKSMTHLFSWLYARLLSEHTREASERLILIVAIASFFVHLAVIALVDAGLMSIETDSSLLTNPIAAIYTPFSFILMYEVYLLIYYLPKSITTYITKQYEIITLIIIRRLFKDLSNLELSPNWFNNQDDLQFTYDMVASLLAFYLIYWLNRLSVKTSAGADLSPLSANMSRFIYFKKIIAVCLVPILILVATYSLGSWVMGVFQPDSHPDITFKNINNIFFDQFFTILIVVDVLLLLLSFFYTDTFHKVIRNSGFIISTILIRVSFSVDGLVNTVLIVSAIAFGLLMLRIHNLYENHRFQ